MVYSTTLLMFQKNTGLHVLVYPHFHLTRLLDGDPSLNAGLTALCLSTLSLDTIAGG